MTFENGLQEETAGDPGWNVPAMEPAGDGDDETILVCPPRKNDQTRSKMNT